MRLPGFTAEATLDRPPAGYRSAWSGAAPQATVRLAQLGQAVLPSPIYHLIRLLGRCSPDCIGDQFASCMVRHCGGIRQDRFELLSACLSE